MSVTVLSTVKEIFEIAPRSNRVEFETIGLRMRIQVLDMEIGATTCRCVELKRQEDTAETELDTSRSSLLACKRVVGTIHAQI